MSATRDQPDPESTVRGLAVGQKHFGRFVLRRPLGRGGMGFVWLAHDEVLGEETALKFLPEYLRWDQAALSELKAETRRARQLTHPNIVRIHDVVEGAGMAAIAMEYIAGKTLTEIRLAQPAGVLGAEEVAPWLEQLGRALDYAHHEAALVHRDLKPANLMLTPEGRLKITDFGVSRSLGESVLRSSQLVLTGGTLLYMSPQQAFGEPATPADDIYALGATLYELLTGRPPFYTGNVQAQLERRRPDRIAERRRQLGVQAGAPIPESWEEVIAACLEKDVARRPRTAGEAVRALREAAAGPLDTRARPAETHAGGAAGTGRRRWREAWRERVSAPRTRRGLGFVGGAGLLAVAALFVLRPAGIDWPRLGPAASGASPAPARHASDATRAVAAWNFDGNGREANGRPWAMRLDRVVPVEDRHGRIDRAVFLTGGSGLSLAEWPAAERWRGDRPFAFSLWIKAAGRPDLDRVVLAVRSPAQDDFYWELSLDRGRPALRIGKIQVDLPEEVVGREAIRPDEWVHLAGGSDGRTLRLYRDGQPIGAAPVQKHRRARQTQAPAVTVGYQHKFDVVRFAGAVDDLRLWHRELAPAEVARLADRVPPPEFIMTRGVYAAADDLEAAVRREFGAAAALADWDELARLHADDAAALADELTLAVSMGGPLLQRGGERQASENRHYFMQRFDGRKPDYFLVHAEMGGMTIALGSWMGMQARVLAKLPPLAPRVVALAATGAGGPLEAWLPVGPRPVQAIALHARAALSVEAGEGVRAELALDGGRTVTVSFVPIGEGRAAFRFDDEAATPRSRQVHALAGEVEFAWVLKDGELRFRAVNPTGQLVILDEVVETELTPPRVRAVRVHGVDSARLTME